MSTENNNSKNINNITSSSINPEFLVTWTKQSEGTSLRTRPNLRMEYEKLEAEPEERTTICGRLAFGLLSRIIETGSKRLLKENDIPSLELEAEPEERTTICGRLAFGLLSRIIETGSKRLLKENDIPSLDVEGTKYLTEKLELKWKNEIEIGRVRSSKSRLRNAVLRALDKYWLFLIVLLANLETLLVMIQPVLLSFLLAEMSNNSPVDMGMLLVYYDKRSNFENFYVSRPNFWPFYG